MSKKTAKVKNDVYEVLSTTEGFPEAEKALFNLWDKQGWKSLTSFLVAWTDSHQPENSKYSLRWWVGETNGVGVKKNRPIKQRTK